MNKKIGITIFACCSIMAASAQTLFTYGKYTADAKDFLRAFNKNTPQPVKNRTNAINDYLDLYINSRLKIREAYDRGYDTLSEIKTEVNNLRTQIADNYMTDQQTSSRLLKEAFQRSQKDIHTGHIFISFKNTAGIMDTAAAKIKRDEIVKRLKKGDDFLLVAQQSSDDPAAKINKGDLGYITVFTLPYEFENIIYATAPGKYSQPVTSKIGYHIFKNLGERKALGKIKAQQILLATPPGADEAYKNQLSKLADSLYNRIITGDNFEELATRFSNDFISAASKGNMPDISVGQYDPAFENVLWSLPKDGALSKPFLTSHGWHIVKRISITPVIINETDKNNQEGLKQKITADSRGKISNEFIYKKITANPGIKKNVYNDAALWALTDSLLDYKPAGIGKTMTPNTTLFTIGKVSYDVNAWVAFARTNRIQPGGATLKPYNEIREEYIRFAMLNYYKDHLEDYNEDFRNQMAEFKDGNLFFEIMQEKIWNKAQNDTAQLAALYIKNKNQYTWKQSADAVVFFCSDEAVAKSTYEQLKKTPADWRKITEQNGEKVVADSARYEWNQIPNLNKTIPKPGMITTPLINKNDNTASFAYLIHVYTQPMPRSFNEARGLVINDYQAALENQWITALKKKYPVVIDKKVLSSISK